MVDFLPANHAVDPLTSRALCGEPATPRFGGVTCPACLHIVNASNPDKEASS